MSPSDRYAFGGFVLDRSHQRVLRADGTPLALTPRLFSALLLFVERAGDLLDKDALMQALWPGLVVEENNLNQVATSGPTLTAASAGPCRKQPPTDHQNGPRRGRHPQGGGTLSD